VTFTAKRWGVLPKAIEYRVFRDGQVIGKRKSYHDYNFVSIITVGSGLAFSFHRKPPKGPIHGLTVRVPIQEAGPEEAKP